MADLINPTGWSDWVSSSFDAAGELAASIRGLFTKKTDEERKKEKDLREEQDRAINAIKLASIEKETEKVKSYLNWQQLKVYLVKYWYIGAIVVALVLMRPILRFFGVGGNAGTKVVRGRRITRSSPRKRKTVTKSTGRKRSSRTKSKGFRKRIGNTIYTSKRAWSQAMLRRRRRAA
jgi:hypothetical protein